NPQQDFMRF
uniref:FMRFamide-15 n=1 Tax=Lucilia cuprina TaxID=7375 RepID=FAR15_LUCCU|nr:RecName: Full=FMRFamide-15; AltName: Full=LucFMRFamide-15 [Lucilia cuprina]